MENSTVIEKLIEAEDGVIYPRLLEAKNRCPPEDVGGPWGYEHYLKAIGNPKHKDHKDLIAWRGAGFDPKTVDVQDITKEFAKLARKWAPKPIKATRKAK